MAADPVPDPYHTATPVLVVRDVTRAIDFYQRAFGAAELMRLDGPNGTVAHAEITIGDSVIMLSGESEHNRSPESLGGSPLLVHLYVDDVDSTVHDATRAGAKVVIPVTDHFYGDRSGRLLDPFGHLWIVSTHTEDVQPDELQRRMERFARS